MRIAFATLPLIFTLALLLAVPVRAASQPAAEPAAQTVVVLEPAPRRARARSSLTTMTTMARSR